MASLLLVLIVIMDFRMGSVDEEGSGHVRFMTYNAKTMYAGQRRNGWGELAQEVITQDPDVLVMQDANNMFDIRRGRPDLFNAILGNRKAVTMGQYVVASRLPLKDCKAGWISYRKEAHTYLHCVLVAHGVEIDLVTAHFLTPRMGLNAVRHEGVDGVDEWRQNMLDRLSQARTLSGHLGRLTRPRIVAGDLNAPERSAVVQMLLDTGLRDAWSSSSMGYGFTYGHALRPHIDFLRIDHILVSDDIGVARAWVGGHEASEHSPVIADLRIHRNLP
ncbi:MAG: endonuclease/exonuclease/phosphatase family protein [Aquabacterium sp.]